MSAKPSKLMDNILKFVKFNVEHCFLTRTSKVRVLTDFPVAVLLETLLLPNLSLGELTVFTRWQYYTPSTIFSEINK